MKAIFSLELIADDAAQAASRMPFDAHKWLRAASLSRPSLRPSVSAIDMNGTPCAQLQFRRDYTRANGCGSRGVYAVYELDDGCYHVRERTGWRKSREYYVRAEFGSVAEISKNEAAEWAKNRLEKMS